jgi:eukaryotic-like serine/threonine-protein kinase
MVEYKELREGASVAGYTLEQRVREENGRTFFTAVDEDGERWLMKLMPADDPAAEPQYANWQRTRHLRHQHVLEVRDVGRAELDGNNYIFCVFESPDDVLSSALEQGPLSVAETRGVLEAVLAALRYLHAQGLVHGSLTADQIVAVGETTKLATYTVREPAVPNEHTEDVRQLGELVRKLRAPEPLTEPFASIARHATAAEPRRWTLAEIARELQPPPPVVAAPVVPPAASAPLPVPVSLPAPVHPIRRDEEEPAPSKGFPKWIIAGVAILLFSILLFNLRRKPEAVQSTPIPAPPPVTTTSPTPAEVVKPAAPAPRSAPPQATGVWRVIAFTYHSHDMASKKAKAINARWPDLGATVFTPRGRRGYYLVALGDRMTRSDATRLQRKARSMGLPRDTFVQNYSE